MTNEIRDLYAGLAMQALLQRVGPLPGPHLIAYDAYAFALAMLEERTRLDTLAKPSGEKQ